MMQISMIAAMANNRVIGADNAMPWHLPADLKHFKKVTLGKPIIMGRKTYTSIGKALPGRLNIVVSSDIHFSLVDATVVNSCEQAIEVADEYCKRQQSANPEVMIIGGGSIYSLLIEHADTLHLTFIDKAVAGDTQFPDWNGVAQWQEISREAHSADEQNPHDYVFVTLTRD